MLVGYYTDLVGYGDNISLRLFFSGCNMKCPHCFNYDTCVKPDSGNSSESGIPLSEIKWYYDVNYNFFDSIIISGGEPLLSTEDEVFKFIMETDKPKKIETNLTIDVDMEFLKQFDYVCFSLKNYSYYTDEQRNTLKKNIERLVGGEYPGTIECRVVCFEDNTSEISKIFEFIGEETLQKFKIVFVSASGGTTKEVIKTLPSEAGLISLFSPVATKFGISGKFEYNVSSNGGEYYE